jgi:hypothetical protein
VLGKPQRPRPRIRRPRQARRRFLTPFPRHGLKLTVELLQLTPAFLARALLLDLRFRVAGPRIIRRRLGPHLQGALLLHLQLLLPQCLVQLQLLHDLPLPGIGRRILHAALMLLHPELQPILLMLALEQVLLQSARAAVVGR